ncbi:MAG: energy transducer TonB [Acidobacteriaceae bacterium]
MNLLFLRQAPAAFLLFAVVACAALPARANDRKVQRRCRPVYPELARRMHIEGTVRIEVAIAPSGAVTRAKVVSGNSLLAPAAERAIRKWKFAPESTPSTENINVDFRLSD